VDAERNLVTAMKTKTEPVFAGNASPDAVHASVVELFENFRDAAAIMPTQWVATVVADLATATTFNEPGRRGDAYRRAMSDLHEALTDANDRLQRCKAAPAKPPVPLRALVG
jgi:hypothetical protein